MSPQTSSHNGCASSPRPRAALVSLAWVKRDTNVNFFSQVDVSASTGSLTQIFWTIFDTLDIFKSIYRTEGIRGYYQGFMATLLAFTPSSVAHWAGYEATKKVLFNHFSAKEQHQIQTGHTDGFYVKHQLSQNHALIVGLSAVNASILGHVFSSPFDMVRVRLQLLDGFHREQAEQLKKGWWAMAKLIAKEEGVRGFFKGMAPKLMAGIPGGMGYLFAYEYIKENLESDSIDKAASSTATPSSLSSSSSRTVSSIISPTYSSS